MIPDPPPPAFIYTFSSDHLHSLVAAWQGHLDAGRIGRRVPINPAVRASILAAEAVVGGRRRGR